MTETTAEIIDRFKALYAFDLQILRLEQDLTRSPGRLQEHRKAEQAVAAKIKMLTDKAAVLRAQAKIRENELKTREDKVAKLKEQSSEVRTNKEFVAFRAEIANMQDEVDSLQGEILKIMDVLEQADAKIAEFEQERTAIQERAAKTQADIDTRLADVRAKRDGLLEERKTMIEGLPKEQFVFYERTRSKRGKGGALIEGNYCGGCGDMLTRNDVYAVQNKTRLVACKNCNAYLFTP